MLSRSRSDCKLLLLNVIFGQKFASLAILAKKWRFQSFLGQIFAFLDHCGALPDKKTMGTRCLVGFLICVYQNFWPSPKNQDIGPNMWVPELLLPPKIIMMFGPKTAIFALNYALLGSYRPCRLIWCPVGWWLWCYSFYMVFK